MLSCGSWWVILSINRHQTPSSNYIYLKKKMSEQKLRHSRSENIDINIIVIYMYQCYHVKRNMLLKQCVWTPWIVHLVEFINGKSENPVSLILLQMLKQISRNGVSTWDHAWSRVSLSQVKTTVYYIVLHFDQASWKYTLSTDWS